MTATTARLSELAVAIAHGTTSLAKDVDLADRAVAALEVVVEELPALVLGEVRGDERALVDDAVELEPEAEIPRQPLVDGDGAVLLDADEVGAGETEHGDRAEHEHCQPRGDERGPDPRAPLAPVQASSANGLGTPCSVSSSAESGSSPVSSSASALPVASKSTTVMLSSPPAALAASTSTRAAASRSSRCCSSSSRIVSSSTIDDRPSEQSTNTSPGCVGTAITSTATSASVPSARVMTERCGWLARLVRREPAGADELGDERVVFGQLLERAVAEEIRAGVAHVARSRPGRPRRARRSSSCPSPRRTRRQPRARTRCGSRPR